MSNLIYTPLVAVVANKTRLNGDFCTCTKINFHGFEISISSDQSLGVDQDLQRTDIRVYRDSRDITNGFVESYNLQNESDLNIFTTSDDLHFIMNEIQSRVYKINQM